MREFTGSLREYLPWILGGTRFVIILAGGYILSLLLKRLLRALEQSAVSAMERTGQPHNREMEKRAKTIIAVLRRPALVLLWAAVVLMGLQELGFSVEPLLAGAGLSAGVLGVAVGFGAQSLIKDVIAGIFMLMENQIRVNDVAVINGTGGLVEEINLRTTVLRSENGAVHVFQNGSIQTLANLTREFAYHVIEINVGFEEDTDRVIETLRGLTSEMRADPLYGPLILDDLDVMGVDRFLPTGPVLKSRVKTLPQRQWIVGRELNRRMRMKFAGTRIMQPSQVNIVRLENPPAVERG
jgi:small conductance mechanosensitive channel